MLRKIYRSILANAIFILGMLLSSFGISPVNAGQFASPSVDTSLASQCKQIVTFDPANFSNATKIDNQWLPLIPGTQLTLEGTTSEGLHTVIFTVTDLVRTVNGVPTLVIWDRDFQDGDLSEAELALFAQDDAGNVWNLGEYPEEYEDGQFVGAPSTWIAGVAGAVGGIHMLADPNTGTGYYLQGYSPDIDFLDCAKVHKVNENISVPVGSFDHVLLTSEISPLDQGGGYQLKYHAPGIGIVQIGAVGDPEAETLVLTRLTYLSKTGLANADKEALKLDKHGCKTNEIYMTICD